MKRFLVSILVLLVGSILSAQDLKEIDSFLDKEKVYQSLFYLNKLKTSQQYKQPVFQFRINNRLLESHLINKSPADSISPLLKTNESLYRQIKDPFEREYFQYVKALSQGSANPSTAVALMSANSFTSQKLLGNSSLKLGDWLQNERKFEQSVDHFVKALNVFRKDSARYYLKIFRSYYLLGISYKNLKRNEESEKAYWTALKILAAVPEPMNLERARVLNNLGNVYIETNAYALARKNYLESLDIKERILKDSTSTASTYNNLATFYARFGNYSEAKSCYSKALRLTPRPKSSNDQIKRNTLISNYSVLLREFGEFTNSQHEVWEALASSRGLVSPDDVSVIRLRLRAVEDAISLMNLPAASVEMENVTLLITGYPPDDVIWNDFDATLTTYLYETEKYDSCFRVCIRLLGRLKDKPSSPVNLFYTLIKTGNATEKMKSIKDALPFYIDAYHTARMSGQAPIILNSLHTLAEAFQMGGELDSAEIYTQRMMKLNFVSDALFRETSTDFVDTDLAIAAFTRQAEIAFERYLQGRGNIFLSQASDQISLALRWIKRKRDSYISENDKFEFGDKVQEAFQAAIDIYFEQYRQDGRKEQFDLLLQVAELSKAQSLLSNLKHQGVERFAGITHAINQTEDKLFRREKDLLHDMGNYVSRREDYNPELYQEQLSEFRKLERTKKDFLDSIQRNLPGYYQLKYAQTLVSVEDLTSVLEKNTLLIEYAGGRKRMYVIGIGEKGQFVIPMASFSGVERSVNLLRNELFFKQNDEIRNTSRDLYRQVFSPVDSIITKRKWKIKQLVIIPDGGLTLLPFELLISSTGYLIERYAIYYNYSATLCWQKSTDPVLSLGKGMAGFAPVFGLTRDSKQPELREEVENFQFTELVETKAEVDFIAHIYEQQRLGKSQVFDATASEATFKNVKFDQLSVVHLATHGFAGMNGPHRSGIVFGRGGGDREDNILFAEEVYGLRMPVELVTLSACETGLGKYYSGEGLVGLTRAFFYAGVRSLLVSMWKVQDASTAALMKNFYQSYFNARLSKADALRNAKLKMIHSKEYHNPFYWSAFVLVGANP